jgi:hypothetical protein
VGAGKDREADGVGVLLDHGLGDLLGVWWSPLSLNRAWISSNRPPLTDAGYGDRSAPTNG